MYAQTHGLISDPMGTWEVQDEFGCLLAKFWWEMRTNLDGVWWGSVRMCGPTIAISSV